MDTHLFKQQWRPPTLKSKIGVTDRAAHARVSLEML
jgi:hypothetical protein